MLIVACGIALWAAADVLWIRRTGSSVTLKDFWPMALLLPVAVGAAATLGAGGHSLAKRVILAAVCAAVIGAASAGMSAVLDRPLLEAQKDYRVARTAGRCAFAGGIAQGGPLSPIAGVSAVRAAVTGQPDVRTGDLIARAAADGVWRVFLFSILAVVGAMITEVALPDPGDE
ncbi:hypothetical protein LCGC14_3024170, partial [marine sediment metagenome]